MAAIAVSCQSMNGGWECEVNVVEDGSQSQHRVSVGASDLDRLAPGSDEPTELVHRSFDFLLAREPKDSILRTFEITSISRYFPEYEREIRAG
jgi:hypothetical protein